MMTPVQLQLVAAAEPALRLADIDILPPESAAVTDDSRALFLSLVVHILTRAAASSASADAAAPPTSEASG